MLRTQRAFNRTMIVNTALWVAVLLLVAAFSHKG